MDFFTHFIFFAYFLSAEVLFLVQSSCVEDRVKYSTWTNQAQNRLFVQNHPYDCKSAPILVCSTRVNKFQGTGSRLFFLARCLAEGLNSNRVVVLSNELSSTHDILSPFKPWSNCSLSDAKASTKQLRVKYYYPMDSNSLLKSKDMPAVGALYPQYFADRGYWWWKAQEISYALRPSYETSKILKRKFDSKPEMAVFQVRRTDKTQGCAVIYGKSSPIKCKKEASSPSLIDFVDALGKFRKGSLKPTLVQIVTDDSKIQEEISRISEKSIEFMKPEPAPKRIPDKQGKGGIYKHRALKDALDIFTMSFGNPLIFTYSSGFGALALQIKQVREEYCSNWASLDWGKREWPPIGTISEGGVRGVKRDTELVSRICVIASNTSFSEVEKEKHYCSIFLKKSLKESGAATILSFCNCDLR